MSRYIDADKRKAEDLGKQVKGNADVRADEYFRQDKAGDNY